ncbi:MAG: AraC family transcriptional regulator [Tannerellaceae bacterium]|nr:AraC family transcriptional regulator [Tannerellaceae bacterium]
MEIDKVEVCKPIEAFVNYLLEHGFVIVQQKLSDYHFHEVSIRLEGPPMDIETIQFDKIKKLDSKNVFCCDCHWSTVYIGSVQNESSV